MEVNQIMRVKQMSINHIYHPFLDGLLLTFTEAVIKHVNGEIDSKPFYCVFLR